MSTWLASQSYQSPMHYILLFCRLIGHCSCLQGLIWVIAISVFYLKKRGKEPKQKSTRKMISFKKVMQNFHIPWQIVPWLHWKAGKFSLSIGGGVCRGVGTHSVKTLLLYSKGKMDLMTTISCHNAFKLYPDGW